MKNPCTSRTSASKLFPCLKFGALLLAAAVAAGCGKRDEKAPATQVAAKVNGDEITVHQISDALARQRVRPEQAEAAKRQVLERLIDQQLARQQALEKKLDRTPRTVQAIEAARSEILARSYIEQLAAAQGKPDAEAVKKYYAEHPELFSQRRLFSIEELIVARNEESVAAGIRQGAAKAKDLAEVATWLKTENIEAAAQRGVRAAEQIPLPWLAEMQKMKDGEMRVFENGERLSVIRVAASRPAPVDEAAATPFIQQFIFNQRLNETIGKQIQSLRDKSNIEYMGEFSGKAKDAAAKPKAAPEPFQKPAAEPAPVNSPGFDKGIRGLTR